MTTTREDAVQTLIAELKGKDEDVRLDAVDALGQIGAPAIDPLVALLRDENWHVRYYAAAALGQIGAPAIDPLVALLQDQDEDVQYGAAVALGWIGDPRPYDSLLALLRDTEDQNVRYGAALGMKGISDARAADPLVTALESEDADLRCHAARALIRLGRSDTEELLVDMLRISGDVDIAELYLNCGNTALEQAAREWASDHGYRVQPTPEGSGVRWGS